MRQHDGVQPPIPRWDVSIELNEDPIGIGTTVHEQAMPRARLDEDRVALADVEHRQPSRVVDPREDPGARENDRPDEPDREDLDDTSLRLRIPDVRIRPRTARAWRGVPARPPHPE